MGLLGRKTREPAWHDAAPAEGWGDVTCVKLGGEEYALFRLEDGIFCTRNSCSHEYSPLCEGEVAGGEVYCCKHGSRFDIRTGRVMSPPASTDVQTFPVEIRGDRIWILA